MAADLRSMGRSPLQKQYAALRYNQHFLRTIADVKRAVIGLAPDTQEAWKTFYGLAWRDLGFQKCQAQLYATETKEDRKIIRNLNHKHYEQHATEVSKKFDVEKLYTCGKCWDNGYTTTIKVKDVDKPMYCSCPKGVALYKDSDDYKANEERTALMLNVDKLKRNIQKVLKKINDTQWRYSDDAHFLVCRYCRQAYSLHQQESSHIFDIHSRQCDQKSTMAIRLWQSIDDMEEQKRQLNKILQGKSKK